LYVQCISQTRIFIFYAKLLLLYRYRRFSLYFIFHFSHPVLHISYLHFISIHLILSDLFHLISYLLIYQLNYSSQFSFHLNIIYFFHLIEINFNSSRLFCISESDFVLQALHKIFSNIILYYKIYTKSFPILFCIIKFGQCISQYHFKLQNLHTNIFQYYFVLQSLHKALPQYYFVLQNLHKAFPNIILFYIMKLYYKYIAIHHYIINFAQKKSQYYLLQNLHYKYIYIQQILSQKNFYIHHFFYTENFFIHRNFYIQHTFTQKHFYI